jgi:hypothetical protein
MSARITRNYTARRISKHAKNTKNTKSAKVMPSVLPSVLHQTFDNSGSDTPVNETKKKVNHNKRGLPKRERRTFVEESRQSDFSEPKEYYRVPDYGTLRLEDMLKVVDRELKELETMSCSCDFTNKESLPSPYYDSDDGVCYKHQLDYEYQLNRIGICDAFDYEPVLDTADYVAAEYNTKGAKRNSSTWRRNAVTKRMSRIDAKKSQRDLQYARFAMDFIV